MQRLRRNKYEYTKFYKAFTKEPTAPQTWIHFKAEGGKRLGPGNPGRMSTKKTYFGERKQRVDQ